MKFLLRLSPLLLLMLTACPFSDDIEDFKLYSDPVTFRVTELITPLDRALTDRDAFRELLPTGKKQHCTNPYNTNTCTDHCSVHWRIGEADGNMVMDCWSLPHDTQQRFALRLSHPDKPNNV